MMITDPIEKLYECHEHILEVAQRVQRLGADARERGIVSMLEWAVEWERTLQFLTVGAAALHTRDEEEALFPILQSHSFLQPVEKLHAEHLKAHSFMEKFAKRVRAILSEKSASQNEILEIANQCDEILASYHEHISDENENLFPRADALLSAAEKQKIALQMTQFRSDAESQHLLSSGPVYAQLTESQPQRLLLSGSEKGTLN